MNPITPVSRPLLNQTAKIVAKPLNWLGSTKMATWLANNYKKDSVNFVAKVSLASVVLKDALGCVLYVYQSLHNEKIPKKQRGFVASLDLTNGGLMILTQIAAFATISNKKVQDWMFDTFLGHFFKGSNRRSIKESTKKAKPVNINNIVLNQNKSEAFAKAMQNAEKTSRAALKIFVPLIGATILAKRVIVPFLATPLATWANKNVLHGETDENSDKLVYQNKMVEQTSFKNIIANIEELYLQKSKNKK